MKNSDQEKEIKQITSKRDLEYSHYGTLYKECLYYQRQWEALTVHIEKNSKESLPKNLKYTQEESKKYITSTRTEFTEFHKDWLVNSM